MDDLKLRQVYFIRCFDHELIVANQEDSDLPLTIEFYGILEKIGVIYYYFNLAEYKKGTKTYYRADQLKVMKTTIIESKLLIIEWEKDE